MGSEFVITGHTVPVDLTLAVGKVKRRLRGSREKEKVIEDTKWNAAWPLLRVELWLDEESNDISVSWRSLRRASFFCLEGHPDDPIGLLV
jgi:hypothetical protein